MSAKNTDMVDETTALVKFDAGALEQYAAAAVAEEGPERLDFIGTKSGILSYRKEKLPGNRLRCVILDGVHERVYYKDVFSEDSFTSPTCFSIHRGTENDGTPDPVVVQKQAAACGGCRWNAFGTDVRGKGKACKQKRRLALLPEAALESPETVQESDVAYLRVPTMSQADWKKYVAMLNTEYKLPPWAVITEVYTEPDARANFKMGFRFVSALPMTILPALREKVEGSVATQILTPYTPAVAAEAPAVEVVDTPVLF